MADETYGPVDAEWVGPGGHTAVIDGVTVALEPGTICKIGFHEARDSDNWKPVVPAKTTLKGGK